MTAISAALVEYITLFQRNGKTFKIIFSLKERCLRQKKISI